MKTIMKGEIIQILKGHKFDIDIFAFGNGADKSSVVHINLNGKISPNESDKKKYAIQFQEDTRIIAIWDLQKRLKIGASLDLYAGDNVKWSDIDGIYINNIGIRNKNGGNSGFYSKVVLLPIDNLSDFLQHDNHGILPGTDNGDNEDFFTEEVKETKEGRKINFYGTRYERNPNLRKQAIKIHGFTCMACGFDFKKKYGELGEGFIEVHHLKPLNECGEEHDVNPENDMICLCSNCHRMIHHNKNKLLSLEDLKIIIHDNERE